jgi:signal transduction histidine kinase
VRERAQSLLRIIGGRMLAVTAVWVALMIVFVQSEVERNARALRNEALEQVARMLATHLDVGEAGLLRFNLPVLDLPPGYNYVVRAADDRILASWGRMAFNLEQSPPQAAAPNPPPIEPQQADDAPRDVRRLSMVLPDGRLGLGVDLTVDLADGSVTHVFVAEDTSHPTVLLDDMVSQFFVRVGWLLIPGVALLLGVSLLTIQAELRPIAHVAAVAETIGPSSTGVRLPDRFIPREVLPLIDTVNRALERLERNLSAQREFTADAAHELKTPLAVMRAQLDAMPRDAASAALRTDVEMMSRLVTQLLRLAEADELAVPPEARCDLSEVALEVAAGLAPLALAQGRSLDLEGADRPVPVNGFAAPLGQALRNLVENALRHTPQGSTVAVRVLPTGAIVVRDHGPGVPEADRPHLFKRFWRKNRNDGGGAGLGLAIAAKIVEAHGGRINVDDAEDGGAQFVIDLPTLRPA